MVPLVITSGTCINGCFSALCQCEQTERSESVGWWSMASEIWKLWTCSASPLRFSVVILHWAKNKFAPPRFDRTKFYEFMWIGTIKITINSVNCSFQAWINTCFGSGTASNLTSRVCKIIKADHDPLRRPQPMGYPEHYTSIRTYYSAQHTYSPFQKLENKGKKTNTFV